MGKNNKFTLLELLVVIAILGILASILLPSISKAKKKAQAALSIANMKQIGNAFMIYSIDNNEAFPPSRYPAGTQSAWPEYVKTILDIGDGKQVLVHPGAGFADNVQRTYAITQAVMGINESGYYNDRISRRITSIEEPSLSHILTESKLQTDSYGKWRITWGQVIGDINSSSSEETQYLDFPYINRHHLLNADISVRSRNFKQRTLITEPNWTGAGY